MAACGAMRRGLLALMCTGAAAAAVDLSACPQPTRNGQLLPAAVRYLHGFCWFVDNTLGIWVDGVKNTDYSGKFYDWLDVRPAVSPEFATLGKLFAELQVAAGSLEWINIAMERNSSDTATRGDYDNMQWYSAVEGIMPIEFDEINQPANPSLWLTFLLGHVMYTWGVDGRFGAWTVDGWQRATLLKYRLPYVQFNCERNSASTYGAYRVYTETDRNGCLEHCQRSHYCYSLVTHGTQCTLLAKHIALHRHTVGKVHGATLCYVAH